MGGRGDVRDDSEEILFQLFLQEAIVNSSGMGWDRCPLFDVVHQADFPLLTTASSTLNGEAVVACDMPEPCKFPSLDSCQKRFLGVDLAPRPLFGLVLQVGDAKKFPQQLDFESQDFLDFFIYLFF